MFFLNPDWTPIISPPEPGPITNPGPSSTMSSNPPSQDWQQPYDAFLFSLFSPPSTLSSNPPRQNRKQPYDALSLSPLNGAITITVSSTPYLVSPDVFPYFARMHRFTVAKTAATAAPITNNNNINNNITYNNSDATTNIPLTHIHPLPFFPLIRYVLHTSRSPATPELHRLFALMPQPASADLEAYRSLCETLRYLAVDVLAGRKGVAEVVREVIGGGCPKSGWGGRDSVFRLVYLLLMDEDLGKGEEGTGEKVRNAAVYVVEREGRFGERAAAVLGKAVRERIELTGKQRRELERAEERSC